MSKFKVFIQQYHWKILLIRIVVNGVALSFTALVIPDIYFVNPTFLSIFVISIGLGILNAIVKPIILFLTGQFIFATYGLLILLINSVVLFLLERLFSNSFVVNSFFWALVGGLVLGLVSNALENLLGLTPPIVSEENVELRKNIETQQNTTLVDLVAKRPPIVQPGVETQSISEVIAARAALETLNGTAASDTRSPSEPEPDIESAEPSIASPLPPGLNQETGQGTDIDEKPGSEPTGGAA